jgi:hypothetical protein
MGQMTRDQIVQAGQLEAGRDDSATLAEGWLQRWLDSVAASWQWPLLQREATGIVLAAQSLDVGGGSGGITEKITRILDNIWWYTSDNKSWGRVRIRSNIGAPIDKLATTSTGRPETVRVQASGTFGIQRLSFYPTPDQSYRLTVPHMVLPATISVGSAIPWYPNDETMIAAVVFKTHEYYQGIENPKTVAAQQRLASLVLDDRVRYGHGPGQADTLPLDVGIFPGAQQ